MTVELIKHTPFAYSYPLLIKNLLNASLLRSPGQQIFYKDSFSYTYQDLNNRIAQLANLLGDIGVTAGSRVGFMDWDSHRYLEAYFAVPMTGAVLHTINIRLSTEQLLYTINHAEDDVLFVHSDFLSMITPIMDQIETVKTIVLLTDDHALPETDLDLFGEYETLLSESPKDYLFEDFDENAMATLFYTTGTTGLPKGVYFSHRQIVLHTYGFMSGLCAYDGGLRVHSGDVYMPMTPMFHVHAWGMPYLFTMLGNRQVYPGRFRPDKALSLAKKYNVTFSHCVPTIIHMLINDPAMENSRFDGWRLIIGGSSLTTDLCRRAKEKGLELFTAYGMSETCPVLTISDPQKTDENLLEDEQIAARCMTGQPVPNVQIEIIGPEGRPLPHDGCAAGEIVVRSPWLTQGYYKDEVKSEELWADGWMHTGDIGTMNENGYLKITDRIKDVIKTGGEWVSSLELEDIVTSHVAVSEAAVIGIADSKWGERPMAIVVLAKGHENDVDEQDLRDFFIARAQKGEIPKYGVPDRIEIVQAIARTSVGKVNKKQLRKLYGK